MPLFRSKSLHRPPPPSTPTSRRRNTDKLWGTMMQQGIGFSGPCQTPDFVPANIFAQQTGSLRRPPRSPHRELQHDSASTNATESWSDFSSTFSPQTHNVPLSSPPSTHRTQLADVEVILRRTADGLGLRLIGGAEEGTQVRFCAFMINSNAY